MHKLQHQLEKQSENTQNTNIDQNRLDDLYQILTKIQTKNLYFIELIVFLIEKGFVRNQHRVHYYMDLYDSINKNNSYNEQSTHKNKQEQEDKFNRKKFQKFFREMAKKFYPCDPLGFQKNIYNVIALNQHEQVRIRIDENIKKFLSKQTINLLRKCEKQLQIIFQIYLPENFNGKMGFSWQQIKYLQKKLPIIAVFRFLWDSQICPNHINPVNFFQVTSKLIPPPSLIMSSGKQGLFYSPQNIINYAKQSVNQKKMKLLQGDIGVNYFQFQMLLVRLSIDFTKQKNDCTKAFQGLVSFLKLGQIIATKGQTRSKPTRFEENVRTYFQQSKKFNRNNLQLQKRQTKKKIEEILQQAEQLQQESKNQFKDSNISINDLQNIKKNLDDQLPQIPQRSLEQKQNDRNYNIQQKHIVIGQQLPKIPQKNKPVAQPKKVDKKDALINKFKFQKPVASKQSTDNFHEIAKIPRKIRMNHQFPIILIDAVYPSDIPNLYINPKCQIFLQTAYIHLGQRSYQKAFINYTKAKTICDFKSQTIQFFFHILQAQIYEAAAHDGMALFNYFKAKQLGSKDGILKYIAYKGLGSCLYHMEEYQYSLRCFLKAKQVRGDQIELQSVQNAVLQNNIGCIYMILNRNNQAMKHFSLSHSLMDLKLGKFHEKSVIVQQNQTKNKKALIEMIPKFKTMWKTYQKKATLKTASKTQKKK